MKKALKILLLVLVAAYASLVAYAYWPTGVEEQPARSLADPDDQFVMIDNLQIRYREYGQAAPDKPDLVLLHGFGNSLQSFRRLAPLLADDFHVVALDMPGFGLSSKPVDYDYRGPNQARTVGAFIRELKLERVVIGGHSLGGAIALRVAINEPTVHGLVLMNPGIINTGVPAITQYLFFPLPRLSAKQFSDREFRERFLRLSFVDQSVVTDEVMDNLMLATRSEGHMAGTTSMMGQYEAATEISLLGQLDKPAIIVWGAADKNKTAEELASLREGLRDDTLINVPGAGHYVHEEAPQAVAAGLIAEKSRLLCQAGSGNGCGSGIEMKKK
jgi:magnesium chelatase accessory protein